MGYNRIIMYATKHDAMGVSQDGERPQHGQYMSKHVKTTAKLLMFARFAWIWGYYTFRQTSHIVGSKHDQLQR